ncbi:MAG: F0F1 ATP synthase subunit delta [Proteobacteria bacterium]|nr:F0F1 ATP synthase subunit delta [Pseudomonadota bacterium]
MSELITLARPYAKAAFEFAKSESDIEAWSEELTIAAGLAQDEQVKGFFKQPDVATDQLIDLICGHNSSEHYKNYVRLLAENDRLSLLPEVAKLYHLYKEQDASSQSVEVFSAVELSETQKQALISALSKKTGKKISLQTHIDETLLGGARIHCGDLVVDGTLRGKVNRLKTELGV